MRPRLLLTILAFSPLLLLTRSHKGAAEPTGKSKSAPPVASLTSGAVRPANSEVVSFPNGKLMLHGVLYKPGGTGPFPAVLYNHGSARDSSAAIETLGPVFADRGWVFFAPHRRGQGLSASAGPYIGDEIAAAEKKGGFRAAAATMARLLETDHLNDQLATLAWLRKRAFVQPDCIAVAGNSFGGIEAVLGAERGSYCAAIDAAGAAQSWAMAPELRALMVRAVRNSQVRYSSFRPRTITIFRLAGLSPPR